MAKTLIDGQRIPGSLSDVAKKAGVSLATVSRVVNNAPNVKAETREAVLRTLNKSRFSLRKSPVTRATVGVARRYFRPGQVLGVYDRAVLAGIFEGAMIHKFNIYSIDMTAERQIDETYAQMMVRMGLDGIIHMQVLPVDEQLIRDVADAGFQQCVLSGRFDHKGVCWVDVENFESTRRAIRYLVNLGHKRIAMMSGSLASYDQQQRFEGFKAVLEEAGIEFNPQRDLVECKDVSTEIGTSATFEMLAGNDRPTAIYYANDQLAMGGVKACHKLGVKIPEDVSIVCFADSPMPEYMSPSLTYIHQPAYDIGRWTTELLAAQLKGEATSNNHRVIVPDFSINESTGPAKTAQ